MKNNKKGFTIVELVIVIAVIAILAAVLIPTFSGVVKKANTSAALQEATSAMKSTLAMSTTGTIEEGTKFFIVSNSAVSYSFVYSGNQIKEAADSTLPTKYNSVIVRGVESGDSYIVDSTVEDLIEVVFGVDGTGWTYNVSSMTNGYYTVTTASENLRIYINSDYPKDLVTVTNSK